MNATRTKNSQNRYSGVDATEFAFNQQAGAAKSLGPILGNLKILGALSTAKGVDLGSLVAIYNDSASTAWAKMGTDSSVSAPTGGTDGIALAPRAYTILAMYDSNFIICSAATCFGYLINDDLTMNPKSGSNS